VSSRRGRTLVTGGAGFIGSALVWGLNQRGDDRILVVDRLDSTSDNTSKARNLAPLRFDDYIDADALLDQLESLDEVGLVLHMGACSSTTETDVAFLQRNNVDYTTTLAEWALRRGIRFVYASSAATYGSREGRVPEDLPIEALRPLNPYGNSKQLFDLYASRRGFLETITGLKYFNVFGPNERHKGDMRSMADKAFHQIVETGGVRLFRSHRPDYADGEQRRDFLYVKDAVEMTLHLAGREAPGLINIGSGCSHTWLELTGAVFAAMGRQPRVEFIDMPASIRDQYQYDTCAAGDRLRASGYDRPVTPLAEAIQDYVQEYLLPDRRLGEVGGSERTRPTGDR
jgi:ADP-L-glycero-D-manno-heptose 6-epimerase